MHHYLNGEEVSALLELHRDLSEIKNRKASYVENIIAREILVRLPLSIRMGDKEIPEDGVEELLSDLSSEEREALKMSSALLKYARNIITSQEDKSKRYKNRVKEAMRILDELQQYYVIKGIKEAFQSKIEDKDQDLQFFALQGLAGYYNFEIADALTKAEEEKLEAIIRSTKVRETASTCCQILINADKIDEIGALIRMDAWKDRNWK